MRKVECLCEAKGRDGTKVSVQGPEVGICLDLKKEKSQLVSTSFVAD